MGQRQLFTGRPHQGGEQLECVLVVLAPKSDFYGGKIIAYPPPKHPMAMVWGVTLATESSILTARWMAKPLLTANQAVRGIRGQWRPEERRAAITMAQTREINDLAQSFSQMARSSMPLLQHSRPAKGSFAAWLPVCRAVSFGTYCGQMALTP